MNTLTIGRKKYNDITSLKEASEIFERARQEHLYNGGGGSDFYDGKLTFNKERFTISWNGRVWKGTKCGGEIAYDNRRSDVKAYFNADRDLLWCAVCTISDESEALTASDLGEDGGQVCDACGRVYNATAATWEGAPSPVTDEQIRALRNEALEAGDAEAQAAIDAPATTVETSIGEQKICGYCGGIEINVGDIFTSTVHGQLCRYCENKLVDFRFLACQNSTIARAAAREGLDGLAGAAARASVHWAKIAYHIDGATEAPCCRRGRH